MPRKAKRVQTAKEKAQQKSPPQTENSQNSSAPSDRPTQHLEHVDLVDLTGGHHSAMPVGGHGGEQVDSVAGLTWASLGSLAVANARSTDEHFLRPPPQPDREYAQLHHHGAPGSGNASLKQPAGLKTSGLESEVGHGDVDDDRSLLRSVGHIGSFDGHDVPELDIPPGESRPPPLPALVKFRTTAGVPSVELKAQPLFLQPVPIAPRPLPPGIPIANRLGAVQMLPKTTGKGTGKKRGPYKEKLRESCTSTNPSQSTTISIKLDQPLQQFQQRSVFVSLPDPISEKYSTTGGQGTYTKNKNRMDQSSDDDSFEEEHIIWSTRPHSSEDEKEVRGVLVPQRHWHLLVPSSDCKFVSSVLCLQKQDIVTQAAKRHKRDDDDGDGDNGQPGFGRIELTAEV
jgi:hypothetical protein